MKAAGRQVVLEATRCLVPMKVASPSSLVVAALANARREIKGFEDGSHVVDASSIQHSGATYPLVCSMGLV